MITLEKVLTENHKLNKLETRLMMLSNGHNLKLLKEWMHPQEEESILENQEQHLVNNLDLLFDNNNQDKLISHKLKKDNEVEMKWDHHTISVISTMTIELPLVLVIKEEIKCPHILDLVLKVTVIKSQKRKVDKEQATHLWERIRTIEANPEVKMSSLLSENKFYPC